MAGCRTVHVFFSWPKKLKHASDTQVVLSFFGVLDVRCWKFYSQIAIAGWFDESNSEGGGQCWVGADRLTGRLHLTTFE